MPACPPNAGVHQATLPFSMTKINKATGRNEFTCDAVLPRLHQAERLDCSTQTGRCF